jgi:ankyrin repeat protein
MLAAADNHNPEVIPLLAKAGVVNAKDLNGVTPLMYATNATAAEMLIVAFLEAGADAKKKDNTGNTAFDYATKNKKLKGTNSLKELEEASK